MSLAEKWEEYCEQQKKMFTDGDPIEPILKKVMQRAFYAGAEAAFFASFTEQKEIRAEIDHFKGHRGGK